MGDFFIRRPIVAMVISIVTILLGIVSLTGLPISQYPNITPPEIQVTTSYRGANAVAVEQAVASPIEEKVNGVEGMLYMKSTNASDGSMTLRVTFDVEENLDNSNMLTQNRVSQGMAFLPVEVKNEGVVTKKSLSFPLLLISLRGKGKLYDNNFLTNYASINLVDPIARIEGVGEVKLFSGANYAMRIWLKPDQLARKKISASEVMQAVREQNTIASGGSIGDSPAMPGVEYTYSVVLQERLKSVAEFENIVIRSDEKGAQVRLGDVARVEFGIENYFTTGRVNGQDAANVAIFQVPGSNALEVAEKVFALVDKAKDKFPAGVTHDVTLDTTKPIEAGIEEIVHTLFEAMVLVILVVFIFLQNWRATLIPLLTVPVSLLGTFIIFPLLGFSVNVLSLLGLVLAIGIVVDDAIVVVEAVMHNLEHGLNPREATQKAMKEISGPVIAIALILAAVFVPVAFIPGITGSLYQQFAVTIAISVLFSAFNALTLSPALAALLLRPVDPNRKKNLLDKFFDQFNRFFNALTDRYTGIVGALAKKSIRSVIITAVVIVGVVIIGKRVPAGFMPEEDQSYFMVNIQLPEASSLQRTDSVMKKVERVIGQVPGVKFTTSIVGYSMLSQSNSPYFGTLFVSLTDWSEREQVGKILNMANYALLQNVPEATCVAFGPPPIQGLGTSAGFSIMLQDRAGKDPAFLAEQTKAFIQRLNMRPEIGRVNSTFQASVPQVRMKTDVEKARKLGVSIDEINKSVSAFMGNVYVNDINRFGKQYKVLVQADAPYRRSERDLSYFFVKSSSGEMVPLNTLVTLTETYGPAFTNRHNMYRSAEIGGAPAEGYTSAQAMQAVEETADSLSNEVNFEWINLSYQEKKAEGKAGIVFVFALLMVFLILAAQYESWSLPFSVLLGVPVAILGAFGGLYIMNKIDSSYVNNIFAQVSYIMLIGLAAKNAILIVEFAKILQEEGKDALEAAKEAARLRLRPILMTALAFILGVIPLLTASGAGAEARKVMGVAVFSGMLVATIIGVILIPALFVFVEKYISKSSATKEK